MNAIISHNVHCSRINRQTRFISKSLHQSLPKPHHRSGLRLSSVASSEQASTPPALHSLDPSYESKCTFTSYSNWLIPDALMLGRYPYVEPARCRSREQGEEQLRTILEADITVFACLQGELPPQINMKVGGAEGFLPYRPTATLLAAALSDPPSLEEIGALRTPELDKFLPPRRKKTNNYDASASGPNQPRRRIELDFMHIPIQDLSTPASKQDLHTFVSELEIRITQNGEKIYLHCWGGRGRAGTVGACLLRKMYGMSAEEALERVQRAFDTRRDGGRKSPETAEQQQFVKEFI